MNKDTKDPSREPSSKEERPAAYGHSPNADIQALVAALAKLTAAMQTGNQGGGPPPDPNASAAALEYREIKGALRTHSESAFQPPPVRRG
jgi:hypothetical protein